MDLESIQKLATDSEKNNGYTDFVKIIGIVFSRSASVNLSFLKNPMTSNFEDDIGVDLEALNAAYNLLLEQPQSVQNSFNNAIESLLTDVQRSVESTHDISYLRQFVMLFEYPLISDPTEIRCRLSPLLVATTSLPSSFLTILKDQYFRRLSPSRFTELHMDLQNFLALHLIECEDMDNYSMHTDKFIIAATKMIGILQDINKSTNLIRYDAFYSESINDNLDISSDYKRWKFRQFSFCEYPFILNPETKSKLLHLESNVEKYHKREDAFGMLIFGYIDSPYFEVEIDRNHLINTSLTALSLYQSEGDLKKELKVKFIGEDGIDEGGVQKEWFQLLVREIFDPKFGMFIVNEETRTHWFNISSNDFDEYELLGKVLGLAVYNGIILDLYFPLVTYKKLMGGKPELSDLEDLDKNHAHGLKEILKYDEAAANCSVEDMFGLTFEISIRDPFGSIYTFELKENGANIPVTAENRKEYVDLYVEYLLDKSIKKQFESFKTGFQCVCNSPAFRLFDYRELELLICGSPTLDFNDLKKTAIYENGYTENSVPVKNLWKVLDELSLEHKKKFLFFTTGSDRSPIGGLGKLELIVSKHGEDDERLPSAHTCYNLLLLPPYESYEKMMMKILLAIENSEGFGMF